MNGWADAYTGASPCLNRRERRAAARRERRGIGAWRAAVRREAEVTGRLRYYLPPRDRRPLSEWMRANPGPWPSEVLHGG